MNNNLACYFYKYAGCVREREGRIKEGRRERKEKGRKEKEKERKKKKRLATGWKR